MPDADPESGEREHELKLGLRDRTAFERLQRALGGQRHPPVDQENRFFDSEAEALASDGIACRVRRSREVGAHRDRFSLTVKGPRLNADHAFGAERVELDAALEAADARRVLAEPAALGDILDGLVQAVPEGERRTLLEAVRARVGAQAWRARGGFHNRRTVIEARLPAEPSGAPRRLELDETRFVLPDGGERVDYELELELGPDDDAGRVHAALLERFAAADARPIELGDKLARLRAYTQQAAIASPPSDA